jgi:hypothetical protein
MRASRSALLLSALSGLFSMAAATPPAADTKPFILRIPPLHLELAVQRPTTWQFQVVENRFPMLFVPPPTGNHPTAEWTFEFRQADDGNTIPEVIAHCRAMISQHSELQVLDDGEAHRADGKKAGYVRYRSGTPDNPIIVRSYFFFCGSSMLFVTETTSVDDWPKYAPTLAAITDSLDWKTLP